MSKWTKDQFIEDMRNKCSREIAKIGERIIEFSDTHASEVTWGRGEDHGTFTFRSDSDVGMLPLFHMTSDGQMNFQINFLREKELPKQVMRDLIVKMEANFLRDYDFESYPDMIQNHNRGENSLPSLLSGLSSLASEVLFLVKN